jgi:vacuolar-type H+-ATPase subunit H
VEDILKRLLEVEINAEKMVATAQAQREAIVHQILLDTQHAEQQFKTQLPELQANLLQKAEQRATQAVAELQKRYADKTAQLQYLAQVNHDGALEAVKKLFTNLGKQL